MGIINLQHVKDRHRTFLKQELGKTDDGTIKMYLTQMIKSIDKELGDLKDHYYIDDNVTAQLMPIINKLGMTKYNVKILTALFCNDFLGASRIANDIGYDRAMVYRALDHLIKIKIVSILEGTVKKYYLINKNKPFDSFIENQIAELEPLRDFKLIESKWSD